MSPPILFVSINSKAVGNGHFGKLKTGESARR